MTQHRIVTAVLGLLLLFAGLSSCAKPEQKPAIKIVDALPSIVASVNGVKIERAAVSERVEQARSMLAHQQHMANMGPEMAQNGGQPGAVSPPTPSHDASHDLEQEKNIVRTVINQLVLEQLKLQEVERLGLSLPPGALEESIRTIEKQAGSHEALEEQLRQGHATVEQWRTQLRHALLFQQLAERRRKALPVSDEEIRRYWDQNRDTLSKIWKTRRLNQVQGRIRDLIQQARWPATEADWHYELVRKATIWVDPAVRQQLAVPADHVHPQQDGAQKHGIAG